MRGENIMNATEQKNVHITAEDGGTFEIAGIEFIKFPDVDGMTPVVAKNVLFNSRFGYSNDLRSSDVLKKLEKNILPKIIKAVGEENVCTFKTDLTTLDGLKPYEDLESKISIYTFDFYRKNVNIFDRYPVNSTVFLATPDTAPPHYDPVWVTCVSPRGRIYYGHFFNYGVSGVRPILFLKSTIFESSEE